MTKEEEDKAKADATASERKRSSDLFAAFPKDATFANRMITEGKSLQEAKAEYSDVLQAKAASDEAARIAAEASRPRGFGNKALGRDGRTEGRSNADAAQAFSDAIDAYAKDHPGKTRAECASAVARANPDVQHAALEGANRAESVEGYRQYVAEDLRVGDKY